MTNLVLELSYSSAYFNGEQALVITLKRPEGQCDTPGVCEPFPLTSNPYRQLPGRSFPEVILLSDNPCQLDDLMVPYGMTGQVARLLDLDFEEFDKIVQTDKIVNTEKDGIPVSIFWPDFNATAYRLSDLMSCGFRNQMKYAAIEYINTITGVATLWELPDDLKK